MGGGCRGEVAVGWLLWGGCRGEVAVGWLLWGGCHGMVAMGCCTKLSVGALAAKPEALAGFDSQRYHLSFQSVAVSKVLVYGWYNGPNCATIRHDIGLRTIGASSTRRLTAVICS